MRKSKYVGFLAVALGTVIIVGAAVLPVSPATQRFGPFRVAVRGDNCGPAAYAALRRAGTECGSAARTRLVATSAVGLLVLAMGMALFAGGDEPHGSRIGAPVRSVSRRPGIRSPGSRRCRPG